MIGEASQADRPANPERPLTGAPTRANERVNDAFPPRRSPRARIGVPVWLITLPLLVLLAAPLLTLGWRGFAARDNLSPAAVNALREAMLLSLGTSLLSILLIVLLGLPLAWLIARRRFPGRQLLNILIDLPIVLPPSAAGIALLLAFGRNGAIGQWLNAWWGLTVGFTTIAVILAQIFVAAPFFVRAAVAAFQRIDRELEEAAADLGAAPATVLRTVTLPMAGPGLAAGAVLAWTRALGEFGATIMFAGNFPGITQTMPLAIYSEFGSGDLETALLLAAILLVTSAVALSLVRLLGNRNIASRLE